MQYYIGVQKGEQLDMKVNLDWSVRQIATSPLFDEGWYRENYRAGHYGEEIFLSIDQQ